MPGVKECREISGEPGIVVEVQRSSIFSKLRAQALKDEVVEVESGDCV
jgi:hypothetical protein